MIEINKQKKLVLVDPVPGQWVAGWCPVPEAMASYRVRPSHPGTFYVLSDNFGTVRGYVIRLADFDGERFIGIQAPMYWRVAAKDEDLSELLKDVNCIDPKLVLQQLDKTTHNID
jgi:hypothetical protein